MDSYDAYSLLRSRFLFISLYFIIWEQRPIISRQRPIIYKQRPTAKDDSFANRILQAKYTFILVLTSQTSDSTLQSDMNITDTRTLGCHTDVITRCLSLGAAGFQDKWVLIFLEREGLSHLYSKARAHPYLLHATAMTDIRGTYKDVLL